MECGKLKRILAILIMLGLLSSIFIIYIPENEVKAHFDNKMTKTYFKYITYDTFLEQGNPDTHHGTGMYIYVGRPNDVKYICRGLIKWYMNDIPSNAIILNATLRLYAKADATITVNIHRVTNAWSWAICNWNNRSTPTPWDSAGGDYDSYVWASKSFTAGGFQYDYYNITELIRSWHNGTYPNVGLMLKGNETGWPEYLVCSNNYTSGDDEKPHIFVEYTQPELQPMSIKITPNNPMANSTIDINVTIENRGGADSDQFNVSYYIDDNFIQKNTISGGLSGNRSLTYDNITYDASDKWGNHTFKVSIDIDNTTWESNENNNDIVEDIFFIIEADAIPGASTNITKNKWTWMGYLNATSKTGEQIYNQIPNCEYIVMQNITSGYYYTYGVALKEDFTIEYGNAVCILVSEDYTWNHK